MDELVKIVVTGPESTGKSELCENLSNYLQAPYIPEFARIYLEQNGGDYNYELLGEIARQHLDFQSKKLTKADDLILMDTDLINFEVWSQLSFGKIHPIISQNVEAEHNHFYLLTYPDLPWEPDPLRENPDDRLFIFDAHLNAIRAHNRPYRIVRGWNNHRLESALEGLKELLPNYDFVR